ncbi:MAG: glycosyl hydrolase family 18 protein [Ruminococcus sp.]|nr:glycosyl hydrolase family 18 protein [Ruminococcus sp.]
MKIKRIISLCAAAVSALTMNVTDVGAEEKSGVRRIIGYLPDWSYQAYKELDFSKVTHINIAFCNPNDKGEFFCYIPDNEFHTIVETAHANGVEVFAALGGAGGCDNYLQYVDTPEEMKAFSENIMEYCEKFNLDGIDLDIELGSSDPIWNYYADWCVQLRDMCDERDMDMSTATAQWVSWKVSPETFELFDFVNVMAYDNDADKSSHSTYEYAETCLDFFESQKKIPREKLVLGVPFYGRGYTDSGTLDWNSYESFADLVSRDAANYDRDNYNGVAYNGASTMAKKTVLAKEYGGIMIWEISQDAKGDMSLLKVINDTYGTASNEAMGDVNGDGTFDSADLVVLSKWIHGQNTALADWKSGDFTNDSKLDIFDLCLMRKALLDKPVEDNSIIVSDIEKLFTAVRNAEPGDVIKVAPGKYNLADYKGAQKLDSDAEGTQDAPITLTALDPENPPVISGSTLEHGYVIHIKGDWWVIENIVCTYSQKGIILDNSSHTIIRNCEVSNTGTEAIHLRDGSSYCIVESCYIHDTGLVTAGYGEGVYVGSAKSTTGYAFECDHNKILNCTFKNIAAEHIDIKEYTTDTEIGGCTFYGDGMTGANYAGSFIDVKGNDCHIHDNTGYRNQNPEIIAAFEVHEQVEGWGYNHLFENNILYMDQPYSAKDTSRRIYIVDGWFSSFSVRNNKVDYGNGLEFADSDDYYKCKNITYLE